MIVSTETEKDLGIMAATKNISTTTLKRMYKINITKWG
jgi:hypothetical protein